MARVADPVYQKQSSFRLFWPAMLGLSSILPWYSHGGSSLLGLAVSGQTFVLPTVIIGLILLVFYFGILNAGRWLVPLLALAAIGWVLLSNRLAGQSGAFDESRLLDLANQPALGIGALLFVMALLGLIATTFARAKVMDGDIFGNHLLVGIGAVLVLFILLPLTMIFGKVIDSDVWKMLSRVTGSNIWGLACLYGAGRCGMAWNSLFLATAVATSCTFLGIAAALFLTRTQAPGRGPVRLLTLLPLVTPPFVVGLALILLFGRSGTITLLVSDWMDIRPSRWIYGPQGIWLAQTLGLAPLAFMVIQSVIISVSPSVEEASSTLRASRWYTFRTVTLPLIRPGIANAFLLCFIESLADLGNPLIIGGGFQVLASGIYFKIVGAQSDLSEAAGLGLVLLFITMAVFIIQTVWLGRASYITVTGKGDSGRNASLPSRVKIPVYAISIVWIGLIVLIYGTIAVGGFAEIWGRDYSFTLRHYISAFGLTTSEHGLVWSGGAWNSFSTTLLISAIAAPITAALGLLTAYLLARRSFPGRGLFEFAAMLSFAMPGTVIGLAYVLSFNAPPIEMTGTAAILFFVFVSRNMPVGVRVGLAQLSQIDRSLDEASTTLGANPGMTLRRVLYPLLKPAIATAIIYAFVSAVTTLSQVIFLVSPRYDWATTYIVSLVENTNYGPAIAYSVVLIVMMVAFIACLQFLLQQATIRRRDNAKASTAALPASGDNS
ncbi:ABC transporter permease [Brucella gallinifaecis]|uniref:ABC transporter permease n=1 Tax=Brucella gallinifaecis TaxID=215590 RepID=UPI00130DA4EF|nr:iron ABC transporter permease [Brucella gallinifaecis]